jgi:hypothetical protein
MIRKIESFVYSQPRSVDEIAKHISKNWRTADRYIQSIEKDYGTLSVKVFRGGSRGALKIVFWASVEKASHSVFQENLEHDILSGRKKEDFAGFDIFQHIPNENKKAHMEYSVANDFNDLEQFADVMRTAKKQLLIFSGNLSFSNLKNKKIDLYKIMEELVKKGISIKIICRIDMAGLENIERVLSLNFKYGKELVEIHHKEQPLRAVISDNKSMIIKEIKEPTGKVHELNKRIFIFYSIKDREWCDWLSRIFWKMFSSSIDAKKRIEEMHRLK